MRLPWVPEVVVSLGATKLSGEAVRKNSSLLGSEKTSGTQGRVRRMGG